MGKNAYRNSAGAWYQRQVKDVVDELKRQDRDGRQKTASARVDRYQAEVEAIVDPVESGEVEYDSAVDTEFEFEGVPFRVSDGF